MRIYVTTRYRPSTRPNLAECQVLGKLAEYAEYIASTRYTSNKNVPFTTSSNFFVNLFLLDLKPKVAATLVPGLPAYILFMCIKHTDYINDDEKVRFLLNNVLHGIKKLIKKRHEELDYSILWLANTCRLLHNLKQYSGDTAFQIENTPKQNEQCLRNFDLSEYRQLLSDVAVWIYQAVIKLMEERVQPLIVPAILEHEAIRNMFGKKPSGMRGRQSSLRDSDIPVDPQVALDTLLNEMKMFFKVLSIHGVDPEIICQVFKQLFYFICAGALNNLLLRKDMCHWSKGMQIRYNLSHLEQWFREQHIQDDHGVLDTLAPVVQASQLLQARKTDEDIQSICDMCDKLTTSQIIKILNLYTPADDFEKVPVSFIRKIQACLLERDEKNLAAGQAPVMGTSALLLDTKYAFPVRFPFNPSNIQLEDIVIPEVLDLQHVLKKV